MDSIQKLPKISSVKFSDETSFGSAANIGGLSRPSRPPASLGSFGSVTVIGRPEEAFPGLGRPLSQ